MPESGHRSVSAWGRQPSLTDGVGLVGLNDGNRDEDPALAGHFEAYGDAKCQLESRH